jgi:hypothetical protein
VIESGRKHRYNKIWVPASTGFHGWGRVTPIPSRSSGGHDALIFHSGAGRPNRAPSIDSLKSLTVHPLPITPDANRGWLRMIKHLIGLRALGWERWMGGSDPRRRGSSKTLWARVNTRKPSADLTLLVSVETVRLVSRKSFRSYYLLYQRIMNVLPLSARRWHIGCEVLQAEQINAH